jgi:hypothetical protein
MTNAGFATACFVGLGAVAVWVYLRYPALRPGSMMFAIGHVAVSVAVFDLSPLGIGVCRHLLPAPLSMVAFLVAVLVPTLTYVFVSWIWLIARLHEFADRPPRGGHPVRDAA